MLKMNQIIFIFVSFRMYDVDGNGSIDITEMKR